MNKLLVVLLTLTTSAGYAKTIRCTNGTSYLPTISNEALKAFAPAFTQEFDNEGSILMIESLVFTVRADKESNISMIVAKTNAGWNPIASAQGYETAQLNVNVTSIPELVGFRNGNELPEKRLFQSKQKYMTALENYVSEENNRNMYLDFYKKYNELASFTCTVK